jgi:drug/metabolite transporter (DMT)-like permease
MGSWYGYCFVVVAAILYGASSVIIKYTYSTGLSPIPVLVIQSLVAMVIAWGWVLFSGSNPKVPKNRWPHMIAQGVIGSFLTSVLFYSALESLGAALATLLLFTYPVFVVIYNVVFMKKQTVPAERVALVAAIVGIVFCVDITAIKVGTIDFWAVLLALGSAVTNAFISVNGERLLAEFDTPVVTAWAQTFSGIMMVLVYQPVWLINFSLSGQQVFLLVTGAVMFFLPLMIYLAGVKRIGAGIASIISTAEAPFTLVLAWLFLNEALKGLQVFGGLLIVMSVIILYYYRIE